MTLSVFIWLVSVELNIESNKVGDSHRFLNFIFCVVLVRQSPYPIRPSDLSSNNVCVPGCLLCDVFGDYFYDITPLALKIPIQESYLSR